MQPNVSFTQILDSRGNPTLQAQYKQDNYCITTAVPSGASTGIHEAIELRDNEDAYQGKGVQKALRNAQALSQIIDWNVVELQQADAQLIHEDSTENKSRFGANAVLANSLLALHVQAHHAHKQPYEIISRLAKTQAQLPLPFANIINGGEHAQNALQFQEFMVVPTSASTFSQATQIVSEVYHELKKLISIKHGPEQTALGDEGGFAPDVSDPHEACELILEAASNTGYSVSIAIDAAASEFYDSNTHTYEGIQGQHMSAQELVEYYVKLVQKYPIISLEDPFDQDDFDSHSQLVQKISEHGIQCQIVGDDLTVTNTKRIQQVADQKAATALLLKINQIGTITESIQAALTATTNNWTVMVSHRSGETEDATISDIATGLGCGQIKLGAPARGERTAKYNRLLTLEKQCALRLRNDWKTKH